MTDNVTRLPTNADRLNVVRAKLDKLREASFTAGVTGRWAADDTEIYGEHMGIWIASVEARADVEHDAYTGNHIAEWNPKTTEHVLNVLEAVINLAEDVDTDVCYHSSVLQPGCTGCIKGHLHRILVHELNDIGAREL